MQIISKGGKVYCRAGVHYSPEMLKELKRAGYKVKETGERETGNKNGAQDQEGY